MALARGVKLNSLDGVGLLESLTRVAEDNIGNGVEGLRRHVKEHAHGLGISQTTQAFLRSSGERPEEDEGSTA